MAKLLTFDVFGTLVDWREGLRRDVARDGIELTDATFENVLADQEHAEGGPFRPYSDIVAWSLIRRLGLSRPRADAIGANVGVWPLFPDTRDALRRQSARVRCVAMTNSDRAHGLQVQDQLGFPLAGWFCAEDTRVYKPDVAFWKAVANRLNLPFGKDWWHISAYADYDLATASALGLTTVLVERSHHRAGPADRVAKNLAEVARWLES